MLTNFRTSPKDIYLVHRPSIDERVFINSSVVSLIFCPSSDTDWLNRAPNHPHTHHKLNQNTLILIIMLPVKYIAKGLFFPLSKEKRTKSNSAKRIERKDKFNLIYSFAVILPSFLLLFLCNRGNGQKRTRSFGAHSSPVESLKKTLYIVVRSHVLSPFPPYPPYLQQRRLIQSIPNYDLLFVRP